MSYLKTTSKYFITTPIFYVNALPHIGHLHSALLADAQSRFQALLGAKDIIFATGTDEHGLKIQKAAENQNYSHPEIFCNDISKKYLDLFKRFDINNSDFIRTSSDRHKKTVTCFWNRLKEKENIYKTSFSGWYCIPDETFLTEHQIIEVDGQKVSSESGHPVEWCCEENYVFKMNKFKDQIRNWLDNQNIIAPAVFRNHLRMFLDQGEDLPDISVSRPSTRLHWGIPVPDDSSQTIYVWLDALVNYLTVAGYPNEMRNWPPNCHVIGKDILKFHAIYWPAFLMAADIEPPRKILCHSHWTVDDTKMSKSKGNVIDPNNLIDLYSIDGIRYFLLREAVPHSDGNFSQRKIANYLNAELSNTLGNLLNRLTSSKVNVHQTIPNIKFEMDSTYISELGRTLISHLEELPKKVEMHFLDFNYYLGIDAIMETLRITNEYIQKEEPWVLKKTDLNRLNYVLTLGLESLRVTGILLQPVVPKSSDLLLKKIGVPNSSRLWSDAENLVLHNNGMKNNFTSFSEERLVLFPKIENV